MNDAGDDGPMYGPWTRGERPRKRGKKCVIIRSSHGPSTTEIKRKSWKDIMKEKQECEKEKMIGKHKEKSEEKEPKPRDKKEGDTEQSEDTLKTGKTEGMQKGTEAKVGDDGQGEEDKGGNDKKMKDLEKHTNTKGEMALMERSNAELQIITLPQVNTQITKWK